jgi:fumarate reductase subunit D
MMPMMDSVVESAYGKGWFGGVQLVISGTFFMLLTVYVPLLFLFCTYLLIKCTALITNRIARVLLLVLLTSALYFLAINFFV